MGRQRSADARSHGICPNSWTSHPSLRIMLCVWKPPRQSGSAAHHGLKSGLRSSGDSPFESKERARTSTVRRLNVPQYCSHMRDSRLAAPPFSSTARRQRRCRMGGRSCVGVAALVHVAPERGDQHDGSSLSIRAAFRSMKSAWRMASACPWRSPQQQSSLHQ